MDLTGCEAFLAHRYGHATRRGNEAAIVRHVESALSSLGFTARAAVAPTVGLAWAACRFGDEPIEPTDADESIEAPPSLGLAESIDGVNRSIDVNKPRGPIEPTDADESIEAPPSLGLAESIDGVNRSIDVNKPRGPIEPTDADESIEAADGQESMATVEAIEPPHSTGSIDAFGSTERIRKSPSTEPKDAAESSWASRSDAAVASDCGRTSTRDGSASHGGSVRHRRPRLVERESMAAVLAAMPIEALRLDAESIEGFRQLSIDRIGSLLALDRHEVAARFGPLVAVRLDEAMGLREEPIVPVRSEPPIEVERVFAAPVGSQEGVRLAVQAMLAELCSRLRRRERGAVRLRLVAERVDRGVETIVLSLGAPNRRAGHLAALLEPKLDRLDVGLGVERLALRVLRSGRLRHRQKGIGFDPVDESRLASSRDRIKSGQGAADANDAACELADAMTARFGEGAILAVHAVESHLPEASGWNAAELDGGEAWPIEWSMAPRPTRLQDPPEPVFIEWGEVAPTVHVDRAASEASSCASAGVSVPESSDAVIAEPPVESSTPPEARPDADVVLRWRGSHHRIEQWIGPERVAEAWWRRDEDAPVGRSIVTREYWRVRLASGWWVWLFRRVVESAEADGDASRDPIGAVDARFESATGDRHDRSGRTGRHAVGDSPSHARDAVEAVTVEVVSGDAFAGEAVTCEAVTGEAWRRRDSRDGDLDGAARLAVDRWFLHGVWS